MMTNEELLLLQQEVTSLRAEGKYKETIEESFQLLQVGMELEDFKSQLVAHLNSAASYYCIGDLEQAFLCIDAYDEICRVHGDEVDRLQWYNILFLLFEYNKDYANAKATLEKSIDLGVEARKFNIASNGYNNYIHLLFEEKNFPEALTMATMGVNSSSYAEHRKFSGGLHPH